MAFLVSLDNRYERHRLQRYLPVREAAAPSRPDLTTATLDVLRSYRDLTHLQVPALELLVPVERLEVDETGPASKVLFPAIPDLEAPVYGVPDQSSFLQITHQLRHAERMVYSSVLHYWSLLACVPGESREAHWHIVDLDAVAPCLTRFSLKEESASPYLIPVFEQSQPVALNIDAFDASIWRGLAEAALAPYGIQSSPAIEALVEELIHLELPTEPGATAEWVASIQMNGQAYSRLCRLTFEDIETAVQTAWRELNVTSKLGPATDSGLLIVSRWAPWLKQIDARVQAPDPGAFITRFLELRALKLPLYYKNLDRIEFRVLAGRDIVTIKVCDPIPVKEGEVRVFDGETELGERVFAIDQAEAFFPVFINGRQDVIEGKPAVLRLIAPERGHAKVTIKFLVTIGQQLKIEVRDTETQKLIRSQLVAQSEIAQPNVKCLTWAEIQEGRQLRNRSAHDRFIRSGAYRSVQGASALLERLLKGAPPRQLSFTEAQVLVPQLAAPLRTLEDVLRLPPVYGRKPSAADDLLVGYTIPLEGQENPWDLEIKEAMAGCHGLYRLAMWLPALYRSGVADANKFHRTLLLKAVTQIGRLYGAGGYVNIFPSVLPALEDISDGFVRGQIIYAQARLGSRLEDQLETLQNLVSRLNTPDAEYYAWGASRMLLWHCRFDATAREVNPRELVQALVEVGLTVANRYDDDTYVLKQSVLLSLIFLMSYAEQDWMFALDGAPEVLAIQRLLSAFHGRHRVILKQMMTSTSLNEILRDVLAKKDLGEGIRAGLLRLA